MSRTVRAKERGQVGTSVIQSRAKGADEKIPADEIGARLWALCSAAPLSDYKSPWDSIGGNLWERLLDVLTTPAAREVAAQASYLNYAECTKVLLLGAPAVHRAVTDIRGLALATAPATPTAPATLTASRTPPTPAPKNELPGEPLVYDDMPFH